MSAKSDTSAAPPAAKADAKADGAKVEAGKADATAAPAAVVKAPSALYAWLPVIAVLLLSPVATWATVEFLLVPRLQKKLSAPPTAESEAAAPKTEGGEGAKGKEGAGSPNYEFSNVVVNLAGTMGTRYLKTSFLVTGAPNVNIGTAFEAAKPRLTDVTLNVLSSLTLADLEEPGAKNVIREKLVAAYNQALGRKVADQVYFSDFVIQ
jgi:flagellar FliL protein